MASSLFALFVLVSVTHLPRTTASLGQWPGIPEILPNEEGSLAVVRLGLPTTGHIIAFGHFTRDRRYACAMK